MERGPFDLLERVVAVLDALGIPHAIGGSVAGSYAGEPRSTVDVDVAIHLGGVDVDHLVDSLPHDLYVPRGAARDAGRDHTSFNVLDPMQGWKVDLFVLGDGLLDRRQIERAQPRTLPGSDRSVRVTSPEDLILRKLEWFGLTGSTSDRQWRDVIGILEVQEGQLDLDDLVETAERLGLGEALRRALDEAGTPSA